MTMNTNINDNFAVWLKILKYQKGINLINTGP